MTAEEEERGRERRWGKGERMEAARGGDVCIAGWEGGGKNGGKCQFIQHSGLGGTLLLASTTPALKVRTASVDARVGGWMGAAAVLALELRG